MSKWLYLFLFCLVPMDAVDLLKPRVTCSRPEIAHGYSRLKQRGRMARLACYAGYELVGDKYATCYGGKWDVPMPVCVRGGCSMPRVENAFILPTHNNAWVNIFCAPKYKGSATLFCDGHNWNGTVPVCVPDSAEEQLYCDFESPDLCGWMQDSRHDFDWTRLNKKTPSAFLFTGPAYDHTFGEGKQGYYMYIESSSKTENETARLISPVYSGDLQATGCFSFFYHMYGRSIGGLRVYQIPENLKDQILDENDTKNQYLLFEKWGNQGDQWYRNVSRLRDFSDNFQIVIEGIRGNSFTSDIAIDDVALLTGHQCDEAFASAVTPADIPDSCAGRCLDQVTPQRGCGCSTTCISDSDCCADFLDLCVFNTDLSNNTDDDDITIANNPTYLPRTDKLIAPTRRYTTTTSTTTTTPKPTTITPKTRPTTPKTTTTTTSTTTYRTAPPKETTAWPKPVVKTTTQRATKMTTPRPTSKVAIKNSTTTTTSRVDTNKVKNITAEVARKIVKEKQEGSGSRAAVGVVTVIVLAAVCGGAALAARSAAGRAALARLRGRARRDPEVRYLTRDHD